MVFQQIKVIVLSILSIFRRALCCFSRRRRLSFQQQQQQHQQQYVQSSSTPDMIQVVVDMEGNSNMQAGFYHPMQKQTRERDWNSWDDSPQTVEEHIENYRQRMAQPPVLEQRQTEPDYFSELAPTIKPQLKYFLGEKQEQTDFSRLAAQTDVPITMTADLEDWDDEDEHGGWEQLDSTQAKQLIREKRRETRHQRQITASGGSGVISKSNAMAALNAVRLGQQSAKVQSPAGGYFPSHSTIT